METFTINVEAPLSLWKTIAMDNSRTVFALVFTKAYPVSYTEAFRVYDVLKSEEPK